MNLVTIIRPNVVKSLFGLAIVLSASIGFSQQIEIREPKPSDGTLMWKFKEGMKVKMTMKQDVTMDIDAGPQQMQMSNGGINEMTMMVTAVDADGVATTKNTITRMMMESDTPMGDMKYDSDSNEQLDGQAEQIAAALEPMIGVAITQKMHPSGKISDVQIPDEVLEGIGAGNPAVASMFNEDSLKELTSKSSLIFPDETPTAGSTWKNEAEVAMGPATVRTETTYTYLGVTDLDGRPVHVIKGVVVMEFPDGIQGMEVDISDEDSTAMFFFDGVQGRLVKSTVNQKVTMEIDAGVQTIVQKLNQKVEMNMTEVK